MEIISINRFTILKRTLMTPKQLKKREPINPNEDEEERKERKR